MIKYKILKYAFAIWVILWFFLTARELFIKDKINDYKILLSRSLEGKRSYVTGDSFYEFLTFCKNSMPEGATYGLLILGEGFDRSIYKRRASYYLYPDMERDEPNFILVYDEPDVKMAGYRMFAKLKGNRYILKRTK